MKKTILTLTVVCFALKGLAQANMVFNKTIKVESENEVPFERPDLKSPPTNPDYLITDDDFVSKITNAFTYWDLHDYKMYQSTLYTYPKGNSSDSTLIIEGENNAFLFNSIDNKWHLKSITLKGTNISLRNIRCGNTSKEVFKLLNKKTKKPLDEGQIWVVDKDKIHHFVFTFSKGKLINIQY